MLREVGAAGNDTLQNHVNATYFTLRWGVAVLAFVFPFALWFGGRLVGLSLQPSLSHYYHASDGLLRDWFVGFLFALGALMYLYKGFTRLENVLLNVASVLAIGTAIFPMSLLATRSESTFSLHGACAIGAFVCLALVAWLSPGRSLKLMSPGPRRARYAIAYLVFGALMMVFPGAAWVLTVLLDSSKGVFAAETLGLVVFTGYWVTKSLEMRDTQGELKALKGVIELGN